MSEFGGLWKLQNNPTGTQSVSLQSVQVGCYTQEEVEECLGRFSVKRVWLNPIYTKVNGAVETERLKFLFSISSVHWITHFEKVTSFSEWVLK